MKIVALETGSMGKDMSFACFEAYGDLVLYEGTLENEVIDRISDADIVIINKTDMNREVLSKANKLKLICLTATGFNNVDLVCCKEKGIVVSNVVGYSTPIVAQHTFAMLLSIYEHLNYYDEYVKQGGYAEGQSFTYINRPFCELQGKTYGIVGMGNIGRKVAQIAQAFGCKIVYFSASGRKYDVEYDQVDFDTLLRESDVISLHCPLNEHTKYLFDYDAFEKMKKSTVLINVARGAVVVEKDLVHALEEELIAGAGIDVYEEEPLKKDSAYFRIKHLDNLILTPHIGWGSTEARQRCLDEICLNIEAFLNGGSRNNVAK